MGLDMYLHATRYIGRMDWHGTPSVEEQAERATYDALSKLSGLDILVDPKEDIKSLTIEVKVGYWRKCNAIHKWFVDNVQDGKDDCGDYECTADQLQTLLTLCEDLYKRKDTKEAEERLPPQGGFFFGDTTINADYWEWEVKATIDMLTRILKPKVGNTQIPNGVMFKYHSSW